MLQHTEDSTAGEEKSNFPQHYLLSFSGVTGSMCVASAGGSVAWHDGCDHTQWTFPFRVCDESEASTFVKKMTRSIAEEYSGLFNMIDAMLN